MGRITLPLEYMETHHSDVLLEFQHKIENSKSERVRKLNVKDAKFYVWYGQTITPHNTEMDPTNPFNAFIIALRAEFGAVRFGHNYIETKFQDCPKDLQEIINEYRYRLEILDEDVDDDWLMKF